MEQIMPEIPTMEKIMWQSLKMENIMLKSPTMTQTMRRDRPSGMLRWRRSCQRDHAGKSHDGKIKTESPTTEKTMPETCTMEEITPESPKLEQTMLER